MSLGIALSQVASTYTNDVRLIGQFISDAEGLLLDKQKKGPVTPFTANEAKQLRSVGEALRKAIDENPREDKVFHINASERVSAFILQLVFPFRQKTFLAEMSLSYLIAYQEAFVKDYLFQLLIHKHQLLRSGVAITSEKIADHRSMRALWSTLAQKEVDSLGYGGIDDVASFFSKKLNIELSSYSNWGALREHSYRRNLIIHNNGRINDAYRKKTGTKQKVGRLETNIPYVISAVNNITGFISYIHASVASKFKLRKKNITIASI